MRTITLLLLLIPLLGLSQETSENVIFGYSDNFLEKHLLTLSNEELSNFEVPLDVEYRTNDEILLSGINYCYFSRKMTFMVDEMIPIKINGNMVLVGTQYSSFKTPTDILKMLKREIEYYYASRHVNLNANRPN